MIKVFCDWCTAEVSERKARNAIRFQTTLQDGGSHRETSLEVTVQESGGLGPGHYCDSCLLDALMALDTRPQAEPTPSDGVVYGVWLPIESAVCDDRPALVQFTNQKRFSPFPYLDNVLAVDLDHDSTPSWWKQQGAIQVMHLRLPPDLPSED